MRRGLSGVAAAKEIGCTTSALAWWESGGRVPDYYWRVVLERWTEGAVAMSAWPARACHAKAARLAKAART